MSSPYKPSPLSFGSPRSSPFRRPESPSSPASPSPLRNATPTGSPTKQTSSATPSRWAAHGRTPSHDADNWTPRGLVSARSDVFSSPTAPRHSPAPAPQPATLPPQRGAGIMSDGNALSKLQPAQVRELREGFQTLDRDSDGMVGRDDVADMLTQLGLPSTSTDVAPFFPPGAPSTLTLPAFLTSISAALGALSHPNELLSAFAAFDEDDSGQINMHDLRDALLHTAPEAGDAALAEREVDQVLAEFTTRRAFGRGQAGMSKRGDVFNYQEFMATIAGGSNGKEAQDQED